MKKITGLLFTSLFCTLLVAQDFPAKPTQLVNDYAGILSPAEKAQLEQKLVAYNDSISTQISIVLMQSTGAYDINHYAYELAERWGIGQAKKNNGVIILAAISDRKVSIQTGYGMEGVLPDAICKRIIENSIKPSFRQEKYYEGLNLATNDIIAYSKGEYTAEGKATAKKFPFVLIIIATIVILGLLARRRNSSRYIGGTDSGSIPFWMLMGGGGHRSGGYRDFSSGSGGFGGFGGGGFGGGGASGSW